MTLAHPRITHWRGTSTAGQFRLPEPQRPAAKQGVRPERQTRLSTNARTFIDMSLLPGLDGVIVLSPASQRASQHAAAE